MRKNSWRLFLVVLNVWVGFGVLTPESVLVHDLDLVLLPVPELVPCP